MQSMVAAVCLCAVCAQAQGKVSAAPTIWQPQTHPFLHTFAINSAATIAAIHMQHITHLSKAGVSRFTCKLPYTVCVHLAHPILHVLEYLALALTLTLAAVVLIILEPIHTNVLGHHGWHRPVHEAPAHVLGGVSPLKGCSLGMHIGKGKGGGSKSSQEQLDRGPGPMVPPMS